MASSRKGPALKNGITTDTSGPGDMSGRDPKRSRRQETLPQTPPIPARLRRSISASPCAAVSRPQLEGERDEVVRAANLSPPKIVQRGLWAVPAALRAAAPPEAGLRYNRLSSRVTVAVRVG